jgi:hypothetical protein
MEINLNLDDFANLLNKSDFEETPVDLDTFCADEYFLGLRRRNGEPMVKGLQKEIIYRMSQIYLPHTLEQLHGEYKGRQMWDETVNEVICQIGKGGGKDFSIRIAFCYIIYQLHCLKEPLAYYDKGKGEFIELLNVAINSVQAKNVFFDPMKNLLAQSPYFQDQGMEFRAQEIYFLSKPIKCYSGHSGAEGWEGYNLIAVVLDEIAAFKTDSELAGEKNRYAASTIYNMAKNSVISRFPTVGKVALLSFPRYEGDFIQERYNAAIADKKVRKVTEFIGHHEDVDIDITYEEDEITKYFEPGVWALKAPSHRTNPERKVTDYLSSYIANPVETLGRFFCMPPKAEQAYFRDPDRVKLCFPDDEEAIPLDDHGRFKDWFKLEIDETKDEATPRFIHIDLGLNRDRAALAMVHAVGSKKIKYFDGVQEGVHSLPVIKMDFIHYWEAPTDGEIDFNDVRQMAFNLADRFPIALISIDRWNSQDTKKIFESRGLAVEMHTVMKDDYDTLSTTIYDQRLLGYYHPILVDGELLKLQLQKGKKVDHPKTGFKDGSDCLAGAVWYCTQFTPIEEEIDIEVLGEDIDIKPEYVAPKGPAIKVPSKKEMPEDIEEFLRNMKVI